MTGRLLPIENAVELIEYAIEITRRNTRTTIRDTNDYLRPFTMRAYINWRILWCIAHGIFDQVGHNLIDLHIIQFDRWKICGHFGSYDTTMQQRLQSTKHILNQLRQHI